MRDIGTQIRSYCDTVLVERDPDDVVAGEIAAPRAIVPSEPAQPTRWRRPAVVVAGAVFATLAVFGGIFYLLRDGGGADVAEFVTTVPAPSTTSATMPPETTTSSVVATTTTVAVTTTTTEPVAATTPPVTVPSPTVSVEWEHVPTQTAFGHEDFIWSAVEGGPGLVAVGGVIDGYGYSDAAVWVSSDGTTWERVGDPAVFQGVPSALGTDGNQFIEAVATGPRGLVAVGWAESDRGDDRPPVWTSADGRSWARLLAGSAAFGPGDWLRGITANGDGYVAAGQDAAGSAAIWSSPDGVTWIRLDEDLGEGYEWSWIAEVVPVDGGFVAAGAGVADDSSGSAPVVWASADGVVWESAALGPAGEVVSLGSDGTTVVAVGSTPEAQALWRASGLTDWSEPIPVVGMEEEHYLWDVLVDGDRILTVGVEFPRFPVGEYPYPGPLRAVAWVSDNGGASWGEAGWASPPGEDDYASTVDQRPAGFRAVVQYGDRLIGAGGAGNGAAPVWVGAWTSE